jgi:hypothetical protein
LFYVCSRPSATSRQINMYSMYWERSSTTINVQQAKRQRGVHTYKEPSRHKMCSTQKNREVCTHTRSQADMKHSKK